MKTLIRVTAGQPPLDTSPKGLAQANQTKAGGTVEMCEIYRPGGAEIMTAFYQRVAIESRLTSNV